MSATVHQKVGFVTIWVVLVGALLTCAGCAARAEPELVTITSADPFDTYVYQGPLGDGQVLLIRDVPMDESVCFVLDDGEEPCSTWGEMLSLVMGFRAVTTDMRLAVFSQVQEGWAELRRQWALVQAAAQELARREAAEGN